MAGVPVVAEGFVDVVALQLARTVDKATKASSSNYERQVSAHSSRLRTRMQAAKGSTSPLRSLVDAWA
ncbi:MAG: hypothetical protein OXE02_12965 [Chloroflexi bacterium]|nr:hypothetical protein [Chloroflexota bacterium]